MSELSHKKYETFNGKLSSGGNICSPFGIVLTDDCVWLNAFIVFVLYQERSKALGYIESNITSVGLMPMDDREALRAPDNVNQLCITIVQCKNVLSRRKGMLTVKQRVGHV